MVKSMYTGFRQSASTSDYRKFPSKFNAPTFNERTSLSLFTETIVF